MMQRPRIPPLVKPGLNPDIVKTRRHVRNDPENQPQPHPRHADNHGHVLARQAQRDHPAEIQRPVHREGPPAVGGRVAGLDSGGPDFGGDRVAAGEVDEEGEGDERVGEGEEDVGGEGGGVASEDQLPEFEGWVAFEFEVFDVDGEVEGEGEERDDY